MAFHHTKVEEPMNKNKQLVINMLVAVVSMVVSAGINFFLSPYIVKNISVEAYGFVGLANNFISYASIITVALNSLAGRFITVELYRNNLKKVNVYFTSVFYANVFLSLVFVAVGSIVVLFLEKFIQISSDLVLDVKILLSFLIVNAIIGMLTTVYSVATFARNKLYLNSLRTLESNILNVILTVGFFVLLRPRVSYLGLIAALLGIYTLVFNIYYTKKLLPQAQIKSEFFDIKAIWEIVSSGIWSSINSAGRILLEGLDLLITNIAVDAASMGVLSVAKTMPQMIMSKIGNLTGMFTPNLTILYAQEKYDELVVDVKQAMKIMGILVNVPIIVLLVCGQLFYSLWQPTQDPVILQRLSVLTIFCTIFTGGINVLYGVFTVVNKLKLNALTVLFTGAIQLIITFCLLKTTNLGVYAVAGVSSALSLIRNLCFTVPYGAVCLKQKWYIFFPDVCRPAILVALSYVIGMVIQEFITFQGWIGLCVFAAIVVCYTLLIGYYVVLNKKDRQFVVRTIKNKLHRV